MGRLSAYAKHRILKLRFKKNKRIIHIVDILKRDDNIKVSRQAVSTFLKKYLETNSIYDKPRTGRKRKLTQEEIQLIGQVTRLNRDITARAIKEYLNLNVSTYTILRATKLFEWNKVNPNSNDSKKAAALERQLNGEPKRRSRSSSASKSKRKKLKRSSELDSSTAGGGASGCESEIEGVNASASAAAANAAAAAASETVNEDERDSSSGEEDDESQDEQENGGGERKSRKEDADEAAAAASSPVVVKSRGGKHASAPEIEKVNLNLIPAKELQSLKHLSCSPMSFATKILFKIFKIEELHGHNVSGKTLNRNLKPKQPLDIKRIGYIKYLVEAYYNEKECKEILANAHSHKQDLWKSCHTAINKSILISERKAMAAAAAAASATNADGTEVKQADGTEAAATDADAKTGATAAKKTPNSKKPVANGKKPAANGKGGAKKKQTKKKRRYNSGSSSSSDEDYFGNLHSEDISTNDDDEARIETDDEDASAAAKQNQAAKKPPAKPNSTISFRRSERQRKPAIKFNSSEYDTDSNTDSDTDTSSEFSGFSAAKGDEECPHEIELIQNIEKRLTSGTSAKKSTSAASKAQGKSAKKSLEDDISPNTSLSAPPPPINNESSETQAASNIAAAMKKRIVVVGANDEDNDDDGIRIDDDKASLPDTDGNGEKLGVGKAEELALNTASPTDEEKTTSLKTTKRERVSFNQPSAKPQVTPTRQLPQRSLRNKETLSKPEPSPVVTTRRSTAAKTPSASPKPSASNNTSSAKNTTASASNEATSSTTPVRVTRSSSGRIAQKATEPSPASEVTKVTKPTETATKLSGGPKLSSISGLRLNIKKTTS